MMKMHVLLPLIATAMACTAMPAEAQEKVKFAYIKTVSMLPFFYAEQKGYFKGEGVAMEMIPVQSGSAVGSAVASGAAHIGYTSTTVLINARNQDQPFRFVFGLEWEQTPTQLWGPLVASERSGIKSFKDVTGKTIITGSPGGLCELAWRDWLSRNGVAWNSVKTLTTPFPQHQAALELGNADASCTPEPFYSGMRTSKLNPLTLGRGYLAEERRRYIIDGIFANETWIAANKKTISAIERAAARASRELAADKAMVRKLLVEEFRLPPAVVDALPVNLDADFSAPAAQFEPVLEAMRRHGMVKPTLRAADLTANN